jgi:glycerate 2-kinase
VITDPPALLRAAFDAAVASAQAEQLTPHLQALPDCPGETVILAVGKAAVPMARVASRVFPQARGMVVAPHGHALETQLTPYFASHPVPDDGSLAASDAAMQLAQSLRPQDRLLCLISGGGSALLSAPLPGMDPALKRQIHQELLASGASIAELNTVRKQLSLVKGGRLAKACAGTVFNFLISDVPGDAPEFIASGPTVAAHTSQDDAWAVVTRYGLPSAAAIQPWLTDPQWATPSPEDPCFSKVQTTLIATPQQALQAAASVFTSAGVTPWILSDRLEGESEAVAPVLAAVAQSLHVETTPLAPPICLLSGGETTVRVTGTGVGGPNVQFLLALLVALEGTPGIWAMACDTDGVDGAKHNAGAWIGPATLAKAQALGLDPKRALLEQDAHHFFEALGQAVVTGPTGTNVNDFRAILVLPRV